MIDWTPSAIAIQLGPVPIYWYGICYAVGLAACFWLMTREATRLGLDAEVLGNGLIVVAIAALAGGRAYHVIDQWHLYKDDLLKIVLPPYSGLGVYGGLVTGTIAIYLYARWMRQPFWEWTNVVAPAIFLMQGIGRFGNFFNQELYGPPTTLPWGIAIDCAHRVAEFPCSAFPLATTHFQPLFLYESLSGFIGCAVVLWVSRRYRARLRPGDLYLGMFIWYATVRFALEFLRTENWKLGGIPTAQIVSIVFVVVAFLALLYRHRDARLDGGPADPFDDDVDPFDDDPLDNVGEGGPDPDRTGAPAGPAAS